jgi:GT2 family glycosyltransferase
VPEVAVLIVSHNTVHDLRGCLQALLESGAAAPSIHVADNASGDGTREMLRSQFAEIQLHQNDANLLYAPAVNQLAAASGGEYLLLLNPDTRPDFRALTSLLAHFEHEPDLAAVAPQLRFPDGCVQPSCRRLPDALTPWREAVAWLRRGGSSWQMSDFDHLSSRVVEQPMFSCILISRTAWQQVGSLDESYPLFLNDVDWCYRARAAGLKILFDPAVRVPHALGGTTRHYPLRKLWHSHRSFARYIWRRRRGTLSAWWGIVGIWLLFALRLPGALLRRS